MEKKWKHKAEILDQYPISAGTLDNWCRQGLVNFITLPGSKHRRIDAEDVERIFTSVKDTSNRKKDRRL